MHLAPLIRDLAIILVTAALVAFVCRRIRQPVVVGYLIAGILLGPSTEIFFAVSDMANIKIWAELGIIFLMFTLGLKFSFRKLSQLGVTSGITGIIEIGAMILIGMAAARALGWPLQQAIFFGCMISISSTTVIIKAFGELGVSRKRFSENVYGILIIEDLAAIFILVALSSFVSQDALSTADLLIAAGKLFLVIGGWFLIGMFVVPRVVGSISKHGNNELLTIISLGLCLGLVTVSALFNYSVALGAFIMGSILAETPESQRIEKLMEPVRDLFGAVFFISVGMLFDPIVVADHLGSLLFMTALIIIGKVVSVSIGSILTGQSLTNAIQSGFSMAQIGEFSFIIASVGMAAGVLHPGVNPIIVAASLITTFTTPYLMRSAFPVALWIEKNLPSRILELVNRYRTWVVRLTSSGGKRNILVSRLMRWAANGILVVILFNLSSIYLVPLLEQYLAQPSLSRPIAWFVTFLVSAPFIWAMLTALRAPDLVSVPGMHEFPYGVMQFLVGLSTVLIIGLLSFDFFTVWISLSVTLIVGGVLFIFSRRRLESSYRWFENRFISSFQKGNKEGKRLEENLAPWDASLAEVEVHPNSPVIGQSLREMKLGEQRRLNVVVIKRGARTIVAPRAEERVYPGDSLLCFGTEAEIEALRPLVQFPVAVDNSKDNYILKSFVLLTESALVGKTIRDSRIKEAFECLLVGIERGDQRIQSPHPDTILAERDLIWVVGDEARLEQCGDFVNSVALREAKPLA